MARITFEGHTLDARTRDMLLDARAICAAPMVITQGSYSNATASAGTHSGGGAVDIRAVDLTAAQRAEIVASMRSVGFAAWLRTPIPGVWPYHVHAIAIGCPDLSPAAADQVVDYKNGRNGLANNGPDDGPRTWVNVTWESYVQSRGGITVTAFDELSARIDTLFARVTADTNARAQYAYKQVTSQPGDNLYDLVHLIDGRVKADTDAHAQYAYEAVVSGADGTSLFEQLATLKARVAAVEAALALPPAPAPAPPPAATLPKA